MLRFIVASLFLIPLHVQGQDTPPHDLTPVAVPEGVDRLLRAYEQGWGARDAEALAALFTEDGFALRPGSPPATGRSEILEAYQGSGGPLVLRPYRFEQDGNLGYIVGGFSRFENETDLGKFVLVVRRVDEGEWRIIADIDNGN